MIEVLWIDDECLTSSDDLTNMGREFMEYACDKGIKITPISSFDKGIELIEKHPQKWCAAILDIHNERATSESPTDDFLKAKEEIVRIQEKNHQREPFIFVLSGNKQYHTDNALLRKPDYATKKVYDKNNGDYAILFEDIIKIQNISDLYKCSKDFSDVLAIAKKMDEGETWEQLLKIIYIITVNNIKNDASLLNDMRKVLETVMKVLSEKQYEFFFDSNIEKKTLNKLSIYIGEDISVPEYIQRSFHSLDRITQPGSHRTEVDSLVNQSQSPYLLRSCLYELCNILIWLDSL